MLFTVTFFYLLTRTKSDSFIDTARSFYDALSLLSAL